MIRVICFITFDNILINLNGIFEINILSLYSVVFRQIVFIFVVLDIRSEVFIFFKSNLNYWIFFKFFKSFFDLNCFVKSVPTLSLISPLFLDQCLYLKEVRYLCICYIYLLLNFTFVFLFFDLILINSSLTFYFCFCY
jgi:hypothetical protein